MNSHFDPESLMIKFIERSVFVYIYYQNFFVNFFYQINGIWIFSSATESG